MSSLIGLILIFIWICRKIMGVTFDVSTPFLNLDGMLCICTATAPTSLHLFKQSSKAPICQSLPVFTMTIIDLDVDSTLEMSICRNRGKHMSLVNHTSQVSVVLFTKCAFAHWLGCGFLKRCMCFNISLNVHCLTVALVR
jgi:hypothetical protein